MSPFRQVTVSIVSAILSLGGSFSFGQVSPQREEEVLVNASKRPFSFDAKAMQRAAAAFNESRQLAPKAPLRFRAIDRAPTGDALRIWIERGDTVETISTDSDDLLTLPNSAFADGAHLRANRSKESLTLSPEVLSPGTGPNVRRLGDLRLQCRVGWALMIDETPLYIRTSFAMAGGMCKSGKIAYYPYAGFRVSNAEWRGITELHTVPVTKTGMYRPPIHDRSISDDAIIELK